MTKRSPAQRPLALALLFLVGACQSGGDAGVPGDPDSREPFHEIAVDEELRMVGTEPFWSATLRGESLVYRTPENQAGTTLPVTRFAGRGGLALSGTLGGEAFDMTITPGTCSDGMSDRAYPYGATLRLGSETRNGCAWSSRKPFTETQGP